MYPTSICPAKSNEVGIYPFSLGKLDVDLWERDLDQQFKNPLLKIEIVNRMMIFIYK